LKPPVAAVAVAEPPPIRVEPQPQIEAAPAPVVSPSSAAAASVPVAPAAAAQPDQSRIQLRANADAWVQVRERTGPVLLNRILRPGETWEVPARPNLLMTTGNAGGTDLLVDGVSSPPLGSSGAVRRDVLLDPDLIKNGRLSVLNPRPNPQ